MTTITTASDLYAVSDDMRALLKVWEDERRCPLPLVDLLLEADLPAAAEAARWAATEDRRWVFGTYQTSTSYPFPAVNSDGSCYWCRSAGNVDYCDEVPVRLLTDRAVAIPITASPTTIGGLLWLLDGWKPQ